MKNSKLKIENENKNKVYSVPEFEFAAIDEKDIITTSPGTETTPKDENDGIWDQSH